ncbi:MAG TPA: DUF2322 family protein [Methylophilaceae bacterium]|jgi:hypothetical protein
MKKFAEILATLESAEHLQRLELADDDGNIERIENKPGTQGSLKLYHHLWKKHGAINSAAAKEGLALYAEHTEDAQNNPGKHPNIDRLFDVLESGSNYMVTAI